MNTSVVEWVLANEDVIKRAIEAERNKGVGVQRNGYRDTTANKAIQNIIPVERLYFNINNKAFYLQQPEKWLTLIDIVKEYYSDSSQGDMFKLFFEEGTSTLHCMKQMRMKRNAFITARLYILEFACGVAAGMGLSSVKNKIQ